MDESKTTILKQNEDPMILCDNLVFKAANPSVRGYSEIYYKGMLLKKGNNVEIHTVKNEDESDTDVDNSFSVAYAKILFFVKTEDNNVKAAICWYYTNNNLFNQFKNGAIRKFMKRHGRLKVTSGKPKVTSGKPMVTSGKPMVTSGKKKPMVTSGKPKETLGRPQVSYGRAYIVMHPNELYFSNLVQYVFIETINRKINVVKSKTIHLYDFYCRYNVDLNLDEIKKKPKKILMRLTKCMKN